MTRVDKESVKNSQQHLGNETNVILCNKYQAIYFLWRQLYKEDFRCHLIYSLQSTICVQSAVWKCYTADDNFPSSFVCTSANLGYNGIFSATDILQIAVVIREVAFVLFLSIFSRSKTTVLTKPRPQGFSVAVPSSGDRKLLPSLINASTWVLTFPLFTRQGFPINKQNREKRQTEKKRENKLGIPVARFPWINLVGVWTVLVIKT